MSVTSCVASDVVFADASGTLTAVPTIGNCLGHIPIAEADQAKCAFWWRNKLYVYKTMPYGMRNASSAFQPVMDGELIAAGLTGWAGTATWRKHMAECL
jgi:hypothetical protein